MKDVFQSLKEMEWDNTIPKEALIYEPDTWFTKLPRCKWKTQRYWWNNGTDESLSTNPPTEEWVRGRIPDKIKNFKSKVGAQKGIAKNTNRKRDAKGRLLPNK